MTNYDDQNQLGIEMLLGLVGGAAFVFLIHLISLLF